MDRSQTITKVADLVKSELEGEGSGHDWWHIYRVWQLAKTIGAGEDVDMFIVELGALLHDIADHKFHGGDSTIGADKTREILSKFDLEADVIEAVAHIVETISFKGDKESKVSSLEGKVVQDADRLDALGAIGIARSFAYDGYKQRPFYDPNIKPDPEGYKARGGSANAINHFSEKLLLLKDLMNTKTGRQIAEHRHQFMEQFLAEFYSEWEGER